MEYLFIGGAHHGRRLSLAQAKPLMRLPVDNTEALAYTEQPPLPWDSPFKVEEYRRIDVLDRCIYVLRGMALNDVLLLLIDGFQPFIEAYNDKRICQEASPSTESSYQGAS